VAQREAAQEKESPVNTKMHPPDPVSHEDDYFDCKDVYQLTGPARQFEELKMAFESSGYAIRSTEVSPHGLPVVVLRLRCGTAPRFSEAAQLVHHVREIIDSVRIRLPKDGLSVGRIGSRLLVAFVWQPPAPGSVETVELDELLSLLP
jgi:hypothetical protein